MSQEIRKKIKNKRAIPAKSIERLEVKNKKRKIINNKRKSFLKIPTNLKIFSHFKV